MDRRDASFGIIWSTFGVLLVLWAGHVWAAHYPSGRVWGIVNGFLLPPVWRWAIWIIGLIFISPPLAASIAGWVDKLGRRWPKLLAIPSPGRTVIFIIFLFAVLFTFRSRAFIFGDGYRMLERLAEAGPAVMFSTDIIMEILDFGWHWLNHRLWAAPLGLSPALTYGILNSIAGVLMLVGLARLIRELAAVREQRLLLWAAVSSSGTLLLGFGYVESYTWALAGAVWALVYAVRSVGKPESWRIALVLWLVSVGFHLLAMVFAPAILWAFLMRKKDRPIQLRRLLISLGVLVLAGALAAAYPAGTRLFVFPPPGFDNPYVLWSPVHIIDLGNILLLVAPAVIPLLAMALTAGRRVKLGGGWSILMIAALGAWWAAVVIDPSLGAARDWDLLSYFGPFLCLGAAGWFLLRRPETGRIAMCTIAVQLFGLCIFHNIPWIIAHQDAGRAMEFMDMMLVDDPHLSTDYDHASRAVDFGKFSISDEVKRYDLGTKYFERRVTAVPDDPDAWWCLGSMYWYRGLPDSCYYAYRRSLSIDSTNAVFWHNFGLLLLGQERIADAKTCFLHVLDLKTDNWQVAWGLGDIYHREKKHDSAAAMYRLVTHIEPRDWQAYLAVGNELALAGQYQAALVEFNEALRLNPSAAIVNRRVLEFNLIEKNLDAVRRIMQNWRRISASEVQEEIRQWMALVDSLTSSAPSDAKVAGSFARIGEWYAAHELEHVALDCYSLAAILDSTNATYRTCVDQLRLPALHRLDSEKE